MQSIDLTGHVYGWLTVVTRAGHIGKTIAWLCRCKCKNTVIVRGYSLREGNTRSCGCIRRGLKRDTNRRVHGEATRGGRTLDYNSVMAAKARCKDLSNEHYGGAGVEYHLPSVAAVVERIGRRPGREYSIDRIDPAGHYTLDNIRWATREEQAANKRPRPRRQPTCHPDRRHEARGLCGACYQQWRKARRAA